MNKPVEEAWESYCAQVLPAMVAGEVRAFLKRAFYAGAFSLMDIIRPSSDLLEPEMVREIEEDIEAYSEEVGANRA